MAPAVRHRLPGSRGRSRTAARQPFASWRLAACVLLPFAAGFHLSYLLRTINALIADPLGAELGIGPAELGLLTSVYFLAFGAAQIPCGILLDRHGPQLVHSTLLLVAGAGALIFAFADGLVLLIIGRALIGLGVAAALMAGLKAIMLWAPADRRATLTGSMMMLGTLGAVTATAPADVLLAEIGWRGLFAVMAALAAAVALLVLVLAPDKERQESPSVATSAVTVRLIFADAHFWRIAPLSALGIGTSWALQGLWSAPWLRDVEGLEPNAVVGHLGIMALVTSLSGLALATAADCLRTVGVRTDSVLAATFTLSLAAQAALVLEWPLPPIVPWCAIAGAGVATVLGYIVLGEIFPAQASGRANGALNLLQVGAAFAVQALFGAIVALWEPEAGRYPAEAYRTALVLFVAMQVVALAWFMVANRHAGARAAVQRVKALDSSRIDYSRAASLWIGGQAGERRDRATWRWTALASLVLLGTVAASTVSDGRPHAATLQHTAPATSGAIWSGRLLWQADDHADRGRAHGR